MEHYFIINPAAGKGEAREALKREICRKMAKEGEHWEIFVTSMPGEGEAYVRQKASESEKARFYSCGGDGTLNEVINGAAGYPKVSVACYPCGSGNDFVRSFGGREAFLDLERLIRGESRRLDLLRINRRYCANICNLGLDAQVAFGKSRFQRLPFIPGTWAYQLSLACCLLGRMGYDLTLEAEGERIRDEFLMAVVANARFYGGGYQGAPKAAADDGLLDLILIRRLPRRKIAGLIGLYKQGRHLEEPALREYIRWRQLKRLRIESPEPFFLCIDGERLRTRVCQAEVMPKALAFVLPDGRRKQACTTIRSQ